MDIHGHRGAFDTKLTIGAKSLNNIVAMFYSLQAPLFSDD